MFSSKKPIFHVLDEVRESKKGETLKGFLIDHQVDPSIF